MTPIRQARWRPPRYARHRRAEPPPAGRLEWLSYLLFLGLVLTVLAALGMMQ